MKTTTTAQEKIDNYMKTKELEIGQDYGFCFEGVGDGKIIFNGEINITAISGDKTMTIDNQNMIDKIIDYCKKHSYPSSMGSVNFR